MILTAAILSQYTRVTDRQTTDRRRTIYYNKSQTLHCNDQLKNLNELRNTKSICFTFYFSFISQLRAALLTNSFIFTQRVNKSVPVFSNHQKLFSSIEQCTHHTDCCHPNLQPRNADNNDDEIIVINLAVYIRIINIQPTTVL